MGQARTFAGSKSRLRASFQRTPPLPRRQTEQQGAVARRLSERHSLEAQMTTDDECPELLSYSFSIVTEAAKENVGGALGQRVSWHWHAAGVRV